MGDAVEIPIQRCLYRQSSVEQRLSPVHLSEESNSESEDENESKQKPSVIGALLKKEDNKEENANNEPQERNSKKQTSNIVQQTKSNFNVKSNSKLIVL